MNLHCFNGIGLTRFAQYLDTLQADPALATPQELLTHPSCVEVVAPGVSVEPRDFANRMEIAKYLDGVLARVENRDIPRDVGLWAWLAFYYFDAVCPVDNEGNRWVGAQRATWIPQTDV